MKRILFLLLPALLLSVPAFAGKKKAEKIDGYIVMEEEAAKVTDLNQKLARNVKLGPIEFGDYDADRLTLYVYVALLDVVPIEGDVHKLDFTSLSVNEIPFEISNLGEGGFEIPEEPPYEINDPLVLTASWADAMEGGLAELADPSTNINIAGQLRVFGKLRTPGKKSKKKYVVPVDIAIQIPRSTIGENLDKLLAQYTIDQMGPTLEGMGINPEEVDVEKLMELLREWASDGMPEPAAPEANPCGNPCANPCGNPCANPCANPTESGDANPCANPCGN